MATRIPPPPVNQLPFVDIKGGVGYLSHFALDFLTKLWVQTQAAIQLPLYGSLQGAPTSSQVLSAWQMTGNEFFASGLPDNIGSITTAPTADWIALIEVNGVSVGSATVSAGGSAMAWAFPFDYSALPGDVLSFVAPSGVDATAAGIYWTFVGSVG